MSTFKEANRVRIGLKMKLSQFAWYSSSAVVSEKDGYAVVILVNKLDNTVRKQITPVVDGISVKTELE